MSSWVTQSSCVEWPSCPICTTGFRRERVTARPGTTYNADHYRLSPFYDLAKVAISRMAWAHAKNLEKHGATAVSMTAGWLRSEMMLEAFGVREDNWRDATAKVPHFVISETPHFVGRAIAALAADPDRGRWNGQSLSSGGLAPVYGFAGLDGSRPDAWRYLVGAGGREAGGRHRLQMRGVCAYQRNPLQ